MTDLEKVSEMTVFPEEERRVKFATLHGDGHGSKGVYCVVVYLYLETEDGSVQNKPHIIQKQSHAIFAQSIPRLELLAALILACLISSIQEALAQVLNIREIFCWTESITVFYWIRSNKQYKQFLQNRIDEIHKLIDVKSCPGVENPAELGFRGCLASELVENSLWWEGPAWLRGPPRNNPNSGVLKAEDLSEECRPEFKAREQNLAIL